MEHMTFWQQFTMALAHGGPPTVAAVASAYFTYRGIIASHKRHAEAIRVQLNGGLTDRIKTAIQEILREQ